MSKKNMTLRLEESIIDDLDNEAEQENMSRSEYVREIIHDRETPQSEIESNAEHAMLREAVNRLEGEVTRLHDENERLTRQLESQPVQRLEEDNRSGLLTRLRGVFG